MKINKRIFAIGISLLFVVGAITSISALDYSFVSGKQFQNVTAFDIPGYGSGKYMMAKGSQKATTEPTGSVKKVSADAALGNYVALVDIKKKQVSQEVNLITYTQWAPEYGTKKGTIYFTSIRSSYLEPSNSCDAKYKFSADRLE